MYASHPAARDRVAAGATEPSRGVFGGLDAPASVLFRSYDNLCQRSTLCWYNDEAGLKVRSANLVPTTTLVADYERDQATAKASEQLLGTLWRGSTLFAPAGDPLDPVDREALAKEADAADEAFQQAIKKEVAIGGRSRDLAEARERLITIRGRIAQAATAVLPRLATGPEADRLHATLLRFAGIQRKVDDVREGFHRLAASFNILDVRGEDTVSSLESKRKCPSKPAASHPSPTASARTPTPSNTPPPASPLPIFSCLTYPTDPTRTRSWAPAATP